MQLCNVKIVGNDNLADIKITNRKIKDIVVSERSEKSSEENEIYFEDAIVFPGLVNSHDHLDFNLFPQTGNRIYKNYKDWGKDIHLKNTESIHSILKIPKELRIQWGLYKNLLNGITTVVNHGEKLKIQNDLITILQNNYSLHSVQFEKQWKLKLNKLFSKKQPYVIHIGEGTDAVSGAEIDELIKWNLFKRKIIGVHGVAMDEDQADQFHALIWCPSSNSFMLNSTAPVDELKTKTKILFGTDSTLTASWNLWDQLREARNTLLLTDRELYESLTSAAATTWKLNNTGSIEINNDADLCIAHAKNKCGFDAFYSVCPEDILLVICKGEIRLFDEEIKNQMAITGILTEQFSKVCINGKKKYLFGDVPGLMNKVWSYYPQAFFPISIK